MDSKICPNCGRSYDEGLNFCLECGTQLVKLEEKSVEVKPRVVESSPPPEILFEPVLVKAKGGEVEIPSWEAFKEVAQRVDAHKDLLDENRMRIEMLEKGQSDLSKSVQDFQNSLVESHRMFDDRLRKLSDEFSLVNMTVNNQLGDLLTSISAVGRSVRELDSKLADELGAMKKDVGRLDKVLESINKDIALIKDKVKARTKSSSLEEV